MSNMTLSRVSRMFWGRMHIWKKLQVLSIMDIVPIGMTNWSIKIISATITIFPCPAVANRRFSVCLRISRARRVWISLPIVKSMGCVETSNILLWKAWLKSVEIFLTVSPTRIIRTTVRSNRLSSWTRLTAWTKWIYSKVTATLSTRSRTWRNRKMEQDRNIPRSTWT